MLPVTVAVIVRKAPVFPVHIVQFPADEGVVWNYFAGDDPTLISAAETLMGIPGNVPIFAAAFTDHLVNPFTGGVHHDDSFAINDFYAEVTKKWGDYVRQYLNDRKMRPGF